MKISSSALAGVLRKSTASARITSTTTTITTTTRRTLSSSTMASSYNNNNNNNNSYSYNNNNNNENNGVITMTSTTRPFSTCKDSSMIAANDRCTPHQHQHHLYPTLHQSSFQQSRLTVSSSSSSLSPFTIRHFSTTTSTTDGTTNTNTTPTSSSSSSSNDAMQDEYGEMTDDGETFCQYDFVLENGTLLPKVQLRYQTYGTTTLNPHTRDNVLVICHALTGNASLHTWWGDLLGPNKAFDTNQYMIVCCNILGSCYGSTSPQSIMPNHNHHNNNNDNNNNNDENNKPIYGKAFPDISVKDTVRLQLIMLQEELKLKSIQAVIGGSFGGMQAMEFAVQAGRTGGDFTEQPSQQGMDPKNAPPFVKSVIPIACGAAHSAWQIAVSEVQRQAIYADPAWHTDHPEQATSGLSVARQMGMISYRTPQGYDGKFGRQLQESTSNNTTTKQPALYGSQATFAAQSYLQYQGQKFLSRFDPVTYVKLTEQMDSHDISRGATHDTTNAALTCQEVLERIDIPALVMGIDSDILYPLEEQEFLAKHLPHGELKVIHSPDGHDGFLLEQEQVGKNITEFLESMKKKKET